MAEEKPQQKTKFGKLISLEELTLMVKNGVVNSQNFNALYDTKRDKEVAVYLHAFGAGARKVHWLTNGGWHIFYELVEDEMVILDGEKSESYRLLRYKKTKEV